MSISVSEALVFGPTKWRNLLTGPSLNYHTKMHLTSSAICLRCKANSQY